MQILVYYIPILVMWQLKEAELESFSVLGVNFVKLDQGWPDFFTQGPFSISFNVLGAASSFQGVEGCNNF